MIVNLVGAPGVGKSTVTKIFLDKLPRAVHISIDECRKQAQKTSLFRSEEEENAWDFLAGSIKSTSLCVVETSGLGWRIKKWFSTRTQTDYGRTIKTIILTAPLEVCLERMKTREKVEVPFLWKELDIEDLAENCIKKLPLIYPHALLLDTNKLTPEEACDEIITEIKRR